MNLNRRSVLKNLSLLSGMVAIQPQKVLAETLSKVAPSDFNFADDWEEVRKLFHLKPGLINLHSGVSPTLKSVLLRMNELDQKALSYPMDGALDLVSKLEPVKNLAAKVGHCRPEDLAITASTTEGANIIINGIDLKPQDEILYTNQEYPSIVEALTLKSRRSGVTIRKIDLEMNASDKTDHILKIKASVSPSTRLLVISHISCLNGEIFPIKEITKEMHGLGIEVLVDGAHALGHIDVNLSELNCDYYTTCFHKWLAGPMGGGLLYCRPDKVKSILPLFGSHLDPDASDMVKFENFYGYGFAAKAANILALNLHFEIGMEKKQKRLTYLRQYWMDRITNPKVIFLTPHDEERAAGMGSFRIEGVDAHELVKEIKEKHGLALGSSGPRAKSRVRITPNVFTVTKDLDYMIEIVNHL